MEQHSEVHNKQNNDDVVHKIPSLLKNFALIRPNSKKILSAQSDVNAKTNAPEASSNLQHMTSRAKLADYKDFSDLDTNDFIEEHIDATRKKIFYEALGND
ncbi:hypothetical protein ABEV74_04200 [Paenibacillus cisolokensis]|uniref:hypothetical protein n=1 Tax=Paenibacillus cisolokensis TaxID=1658519 RepID=UPI003D2BEA41